MTNIQSAAVTAEAEGPMIPEGLPTDPQKAKPAWRSLNFGPRMWISLAIIGFVLVLAFIGPLIYPYGPEEKVGSLYDSPSAQHILGTENFGYDVLAVLMASARNSIIIGLLAGTIAVLIGAALNAATRELWPLEHEVGSPMNRLRGKVGRRTLTPVPTPDDEMPGAPTPPLVGHPAKTR